MHPHGTASLNLVAPIEVPPRPRQEHISTFELKSVSTKRPIQLLSVGRIDATHLSSAALCNEPNFAISVARDYRELWLQSKEETIEIALLHNSLCSFELEEAARLVRCRWPKAKILIIRFGEVHIDRAVYDDCLQPSVNSEGLIQRIFSLARSLNEGRHTRGDY